MLVFGLSAAMSILVIQAVLWLIIKVLQNHINQKPVSKNLMLIYKSLSIFRFKNKTKPTANSKSFIIYLLNAFLYASIILFFKYLILDYMKPVNALIMTLSLIPAYILAGWLAYYAFRLDDQPSESKD